MPKLVGLYMDAIDLERNIGLSHAHEGRVLVRLTGAQARIAQAAGLELWRSLDTSDRGGPRSLAKRWYAWFAEPSAVLACPAATANMRRRACAALAVPAHWQVAGELTPAPETTSYHRHVISLLHPQLVEQLGDLAAELVARDLLLQVGVEGVQ